MPTVIFANARTFLEEHAEEYPHLVIVPIDEPRPSDVENEQRAKVRWIAGAVDGMMHWRFAEASEAESFKQKYGGF